MKNIIIIIAIQILLIKKHFKMKKVLVLLSFLFVFSFGYSANDSPEINKHTINYGVELNIIHADFVSVSADQINYLDMVFAKKGSEMVISAVIFKDCNFDAITINLSYKKGIHVKSIINNPLLCYIDKKWQNNYIYNIQNLNYTMLGYSIKK